MVRAVTERLTHRALTTQLGTADVVLNGNVVLIDTESISLSNTEARLLSALARKPNTVFTKQQLLDAVWPGRAMDAHAVEVGIARLRKRLGPHGRLIRSIQRRGYSLRD
jgi:DNA-binding winged helix-turn-helix (wHTH) protein